MKQLLFVITEVNNKTKYMKSNIGVLELLGVALVLLKLTGNIDLSWWLVTMPFWIELAIGLTLLFGIMLLEKIGVIEKTNYEKRGVPNMKNPPKPPAKESKFKEKINKLNK